MRPTTILSSSLFAFLLILGCRGENSSSESAITREKFIDVYVGLLLAGETGRLSDTSRTNRQLVIDSICVEHGVTSAQLDSTLAHYSKDIRRWREFFGDVINRLEEMRKQEGKAKES